jgi:hypothetical protein
LGHNVVGSRFVQHLEDLEVLVRRRICIVGTAVVAASLAVSVGAALGSTKAAVVKPITVHCTVSLTTGPPAGSNSVDQPASQGSQAGPNHCAKKGFGFGVAVDSFTVPDSGDTVGTYTQYFNTGTVHGAFDLTPTESGDVSNFTSQAWTGTITVTGGTGTYKGVKGKKNTGVFNCTSPDNVHMSCTEVIKLKPSAAMVLAGI